MYEVQEPPRAGSTDTWLMRWSNAATTRNGESVILEVRNGTEYKFANSNRNGFLPGSSIFQINMAAVFDPTGADQAFERLFENNGINTITANMSLNSATMNMARDEDATRDFHILHCCMCMSMCMSICLCVQAVEMWHEDFVYSVMHWCRDVK